MSFAMPTNYGGLTGAFKETLSLPALTGAAGIVGGILVGDVVANFAVSAAKVTTTSLSLLVKGVSKFALAGIAIFLTSRTTGSARILGTTLGLGSVASFFVDLLAASPFAKQLGLAAVQAFQINVPYGRRTTGVTVQTSAVTGLKQFTVNRP